MNLIKIIASTIISNAADLKHFVNILLTFVVSGSAIFCMSAIDWVESFSVYLKLIFQIVIFILTCIYLTLKINKQRHERRN